MESFGDNLNALPADIIEVFHKTQRDALQQNTQQVQEWAKKLEEYKKLLSFLKTLPNTLTCNVMVPIGKKALMKGKIVHTNEILVNIGDGWFVKQSAKLASEICSRRIQMCSEALSNLEKESDLLSSRSDLISEHDPFGREIVEPYDEEAEAQWREHHREKEKKYRQKLKSLRNQTSEEEIEPPTSTDDELWNKLDQLELQEELELELERLNAKRASSKSNSDTQKSLTDLTSAISIPLTSIEEPQNINPEQKQKRRVSFANVNVVSLPNENGEDLDNEPSVIEFTHSPHEPIVKSNTDNSASIRSPADICTIFPKTVKSILKRVPKTSENIRATATLNPTASEVPSNIAHDNVANRRDGVVLRDVTELLSEEQVAYIEPSRPVSRFKAARMAAAPSSRQTFN